MLQLGAPVIASTGSITTSRAIKNHWNNAKDVSRAFMTNLANIRTYWGPRNGAAADGPPDNESGLRTGLELDSQRRESDRYLLLCISQWRGYYLTGMVPVDLRRVSDDDLFRRMKVEYMTMLGPWRRFLSLRYLKDIRFVQVRSFLCSTSWEDLLMIFSVQYRQKSTDRYSCPLPYGGSGTCRYPPLK